jgi:tryptophan-rich sensory protein
MRAPPVVGIVTAILVAELAGVIGSLFTIPAIPTWYAALVKPALAPPNWIFGPVWTILYALMGIAAFLAWRQRERTGIASGRSAVGPRNDSRVSVAIGVFVLQLVLNVLWSAIFFGLRNPGAAFIEIVILWLAILATIFAFVRVSRPAAYLLIPYLAWVSFAAYLNYRIWALN